MCYKSRGPTVISYWSKSESCSVLNLLYPGKLRSFKRPGYLEVRPEKSRFFLATNLGWPERNKWFNWCKWGITYTATMQSYPENACLRERQWLTRLPSFVANTFIQFVGIRFRNLSITPTFWLLFLQTILIWSEKDNSLSIVTPHTQQCNSIFRRSMLKCLTLILICLLSVLLIIIYWYTFYKPMSTKLLQQQGMLQTVEGLTPVSWCTPGHLGR